MSSQFIQQGLIRVMALSLPLFIIIGVRQFSTPEMSTVFFTMLTDAVLLVAICKLGVDVYLPSCSLENSRVVVYKRFKLFYFGIGLLLVFVSVGIYIEKSYWQVALLTSSVIVCLAIAEIGRLKKNYFVFYLLKAPSLYIFALVLSVTSDRPVATLLFLMALLGAWTYLYRLMEGRDGEISMAGLSTSALASLLILLFSWKEAVVSRFLFDSENLDALVMYSRLVLIVTFPFMLQNARIPLLLREIDGSKADAVQAILSQKKLIMRLWAVFSGIGVVIYSWFFDRELVVGVCFLMMGSCVLVVFGNIGATLIFYRKYKSLSLSYFLGVSVFLVSAFVFSALLNNSTFTAIAVSSLIGQIVFSLMLVRSLKAVYLDASG